MGGKTCWENELSIAELHSRTGQIFVQPVGEGCPLAPTLDEGKGHFSYQLYILANTIKAPPLNVSIAKAKPYCSLKRV